VGRVIVIEFVSVDGVMEDPDGSGGTASGGWAFRTGPEAVAGDKFALGPVLDTGVLLLGRGTWQLFSRLWPTRTDPFSMAMNAIPKIVATRSDVPVDAWVNSTRLDGGLVETVTKVREERDVIVTGSPDVVDALAADDLVDQYRLLVFPVVLGQGRRVFGTATPPADLALAACEPVGTTVRLTWDRVRDEEDAR
jgi:dihydrofolate reductase